jgi:phosphatidate cytidylyltransferase
MSLVIFTIIFFIVIGGIGMHFGSRKVDRTVARQRWLKYIVYILITSFVVLSIWFRFFLPVAAVIVLIGYFEIVRTIRLTKNAWIALMAYSVIAAGFIIYAFKFSKEFQFFIYLQILAFDAFSQVIGQLIGKTPIAPRISPAKTVEGFLGGIFFCILASLLTRNLIDVSFLAAITFGLFSGITAFAGDLLASFYKRMAGIKDYSKLLPGQGGFLDRFDGFMMAAFCYGVIHLLVPNLFSA